MSDETDHPAATESPRAEDAERIDRDEGVPVTDRPMTRWERVTFAVLALIHAAVSFHEIGRPFVAGHHGWAASLRSLIGGNYAEHGFFATGFAPYKHFGLPESLANAPVHWHHPPTLNVLTGLSFEIFGPHEWAANLVAAASAFIVFFVLFVVVRRRWGPSGALLSVAFLVFAPMQVEWGKLLNYEPPIVVLTLLAIELADRSREREGRGRYIYALGCAFTLCLAGSVDWVGFILAAFVGFDALVKNWRRPLLFVLIGVSTTATLGFWIWWLAQFGGGIEAVLNVAEWRSGGGGKIALDALAERTGERLVDYFGWAVLITAAIGFVWSFFRSRTFDPVLSVFLLGTLLYFSIFKQAAWVHVFYLYLVTPAVVLSAALGVLAIASVVGRFAHRKVALVVAAGVFAANVAWTLPILPVTHVRSYRIRPPKEPYRGFPKDGELDRIIAGKLLAERTKRNERVAVEPSIGSFQLRYYADRAYRWHRRRTPPRHVGAWALPARMVPDQTKREWSRRWHLTEVARILIVDFEPDEPGYLELDLVADEMTALHWYGVSSVIPPWRLEPVSSEVRTD